MARTLPDGCPSKHRGFTDIGLCHQRHVPQQPLIPASQGCPRVLRETDRRPQEKHTRA